MGWKTDIIVKKYFVLEIDDIMNAIYNVKRQRKEPSIVMVSSNGYHDLKNYIICNYPNYGHRNPNDDNLYVCGVRIISSPQLKDEEILAY